MTSTPIHRERHESMGTWFEVRTVGGNSTYFRQACQEAFRELERIENLLSRFREDSEVSRLRGLVPGESAPLHPDTMACLTLALEMSELTNGAFDPTLGAAMDALRSGKPTTTENFPVKGRLRLDPVSRTVTCEQASVALDLGAIGKGYALDRLAEQLGDCDLGPLLLVAGGSSLLAVGPSHTGWDIGFTATTSVRLVEGAIGCSGLSVKGAHILNPRTGRPAETPARAWAIARDAAMADALSTAFMVLNSADIARVCAARPDIAAYIQATDNRDALQSYGFARGARYSVIVS